MAILCGFLDYTMTILRLWGGEWSVYACVYKIMMVGLVRAYLHDKGTFLAILTKVTFWSRNHILALYCMF